MKNNLSVKIEGISSFVHSDELASCIESANKSLTSLKEGTGRGNEFTGWLHLPDQAVNETGKVRACAARLQS